MEYLILTLGVGGTPDASSEAPLLLASTEPTTGAVSTEFDYESTPVLGVRPNRLTPQVSVPLTPDPSTFSPKAVAAATKVERGGRLTADDLRGLSPAEVNTVVGRQVQLDALTAELESTLGLTASRVGAAQQRAAEQLTAAEKDKREAIFRARVDGAKAIAESNLSEDEKRTRLDKLMKDTELDSVLAQSVESQGLTKAPSFGAEREALSRELFRKPYSELDQVQQNAVNLELPTRTSPSIELFQDQSGVYLVDKTRKQVHKINADGSITLMKKAGEKDEPKKQIPLADGSTVTVAPDKRTVTGKRISALSTLNSASTLVDGIRNMGQEQAEEIFTELIIPRGNAKGTENYRRALISAFPALKEKYPGVESIKPLSESRLNLSGTEPQVLGSAGVPTYTTPKPAPFSGTPPKEPAKLAEYQAKSRAFGEQAMKSQDKLEELEAGTEPEYGNYPTWKDAIVQARNAYPAIGGTLGAVGGAALGAFVGYMLTRSSAGAKAGAEAGSKLFKVGATGKLIPQLAESPSALTRFLSTSGIATGGAAGGIAAGKTAGEGVKELVEPYKNRFKTPKQQAYAMHKLNFLLAVLRDETGASITTPEFPREEERYFPMRGEGKEIAEAKAKLRREKLRSMELESQQEWLTDKYKSKKK